WLPLCLLPPRRRGSIGEAHSQRQCYHVLISGRGVSNVTDCRNSFRNGHFRNSSVTGRRPDQPGVVLYCSSATFSIHATYLPSLFSVIAICDMVVVGPAPCQCFSPGENQITSPARTSRTGPPALCTRPDPERI